MRRGRDLMNARRFFLCAKDAAEELERCEHWLRTHHELAEAPKTQDYQPHYGGGNSDPTTKVDALMDREATLRRQRMIPCEETLDIAFTMVGKVSEEFSDKASMGISCHYLYGESWPTVAQSTGIPKESMRLLVNAAFDYLDSVYEFGAYQDGSLWVSCSGTLVEAV